MADKATLFFLHGKESGPAGLKIRAMTPIAERYGYRVVAPDFSGVEDPLQRCQMVLEHPLINEASILVGSSMGGYVAAYVSRRLSLAGVLLLAPAFGLGEYPGPEPQIVADYRMVIHGWNDQVVAPVPVIEVCQRQQVPLHVLTASHSLVDQLSEVLCLFEFFLVRCGGSTSLQQSGS